jgi:biopolymer transport protein ExbD
MARQHIKEVNAGSTADIAFLLLIFFLVTTTIETDQGINRKLPSKNPETTSQNIKDKNLFTVLINAQGELLVENEPLDISDLRTATISFLDNGSGEGKEACSYCEGEKNLKSSVNPQKAVISVQTDRLTNYQDYIAVQNELVSAYNDLRNREAQRLYVMSYEKLNDQYKDESFKGSKDQLKERLKAIRALFPLHISEAEPRF